MPRPKPTNPRELPSCPWATCFISFEGFGRARYYRQRMSNSDKDNKTIIKERTNEGEKPEVGSFLSNIRQIPCMRSALLYGLCGIPIGAGLARVVRGNSIVYG